MKKIRRFLRQYPVQTLVIISSAISNVLINLVSNLLEPTFVTFFSLAVFLIIVAAFISIARRSTGALILVPKELQARPHAGLIVIVGPGRAGVPFDIERSAAAVAIHYHLSKGGLKFVWMIASDAGVPVAEALRQEFGGRVGMEVCLVHNFIDIHDTYAAVKKIYAGGAAAHGLEPQQVIADYTGGTSSMTAGMVLAAAGGPYPLQFTSGRQGAESTPIQIFLSHPEDGNASGKA